MKHRLNASTASLKTLKVEISECDLRKCNKGRKRKQSWVGLRPQRNRSALIKREKQLTRTGSLCVESQKKTLQARQPPPILLSTASFHPRIPHTPLRLKPPLLTKFVAPFIPKTLDGWKKAKNLDKHTKVFVIQGNYPAVKNALLERNWVENKDSESIFFDLKWSRKARVPITLRDWQFYNHFQRNYELCIKYKLVKRLNTLKQIHAIHPRTFYPRCYRACETPSQEFYDKFKTIFACSLLKEFVDETKDLSIEKAMACLMACNRWAHSLENKQKEETSCLIMSVEWQLIVTTKISETAYLYKKLLPSKRPSTKEEVREMARATLNKLQRVDEQYYLNGRRNIWIVKPGGKSRGRGISLLQSIEEIEEYIDNSDYWVIQKYIENPLIIHKRKFDIRQWVLVTGFSAIHVFVYKDCYLRFGVDAWDIEITENKYSHLTNNCISKKSKKFNDSEIEGCMWHVNTFRKYLIEQFGKDHWEETLFGQIKDIVKWTFMSVPNLGERTTNTFELFGFDFMIDDNLHPWLLEVNSSPSMDYSTPVTKALVEEVLTDCVKVVVDHHLNQQEDLGKFQLVYQSKPK